MHQFKVKHLIKSLQTERKMLRGLPLSKELGRWSGHSGSSSMSSSSASGTSYGCTSNCSSGSSGRTTVFSVCDPVWCNVRKCLCNRCIGWDEYNGYAWMQGSQHHPRTLYYKHMSSTVFSSTTNMLSQHISLNASKIHQSFTNSLITHKVIFD